LKTCSTPFPITVIYTFIFAENNFRIPLDPIKVLSIVPVNFSANVPAKINRSQNVKPHL